MWEGWSWLADSPLATSSLRDWFDIALLSFLIYGLLNVLRGTRAFQVMVGVMLLVGLYALAWIADLGTMLWVLESLFVYAVIAILILFQEDIRRVLARAGGTVFVGSGPRSTDDAQLVEEVNKAVFALASRRIGALIALERAASLQRFCEGAHPVDAVVTTELLQALFHPTSPVHDGAVVISRGRISRAGVFLPISLSKDLPKIYGTRHRAAIGLTARTDAVCLLVSEERGTVAVVAGGGVLPVVDTNDLRQRLQEVLDAPAPAATDEVDRD
jgi:diadenylate cyclase